LTPAGTDCVDSDAEFERPSNEPLPALDEAVRGGDRNYSALFEQSAVSVAQIDSRTGRFLRINQHYCEMLGYSPEEMLRLDFQTITHPEDLQEDLDNMALLLSGRLRTFRMEKRLLRKDGTVVWVRLAVVPLWAENAPVTCHLAFVEDATEWVRAEAERRHTEHELRRLEERFSKLYYASPFAILLTTYPEGRIVEANDAFLQLFDFGRADILGKTTKEISFWADFSDRRRMFKCLKQDGSVRNMEFVFRTRSGDRRTLLLSLELIRLEGQVHSLGMLIDISARKRAEEALRKSEERYELVMRGVSDGIWDWNVVTNEEYHSPRWNEILGYAADDLPPDSSSFFDLIHPDDKGAVDRAIADHFERNQRYAVELRMRRKDGSHSWILTRGEAVRDSAGRPVRMVGSITDIGERKQAEQALHDSEHRYRAFIDTCADAVFLLDSAGNIRSANPAAARMHGYDSEELLAMNIRDIDVPDDARRVAERMRRFQAGETLHFELLHRRKDGTTFPLEVVATPLQVGDETFVLAFDRDITERKQAESQAALLRDKLAHSTRLGAMGEMAAGLAHELNQPLAAVRLYASAAKEFADHPGALELRECLTRIDELAFRAGEIIRRMRSFASDRPAVRLAESLPRLIREVAALLEHETRRHRVTTKLMLDDGLPDVAVDRIQVQQVLINLIRNAVEAMTRPGNDARLLSIEAAFDGAHALVRIADTGGGIDPAVAERLFEPFQSTKSGGLGLGLSICRTLIEAHGGSIGAEPNDAPGTTFYFSLPVVPGDAGA